MPQDLPKYPTELPVESALALASIIRSGNALLERSRAAYHAWVMTGYLSGRVLGDPNEKPVIGQLEIPVVEQQLTLNEAADQLELLGRHPEGQVVGAPLPVPLLLFLAQLAIRLLRERS